MAKMNLEDKYHNDYGLGSNIWYILRSMVKHEPLFWCLIPVGVLSAPVIKYLLNK